MNLTRSTTRRCRRQQDGFTVVEVMVAALIMVIGGLAVLGLVDSTHRSTFRAEQSQVVNNRLQEELERIKELPYGEIALNAIPSGSSDPLSPTSRVSGSSFAVDRGGTDLQPLVYTGAVHPRTGTVTGDGVPATPEAFTSGDIKGTIHRYVVWDDDPTCQVGCSDGSSIKRVIVAIKLDDTASGGLRRYQELQTQIIDPRTFPSNNPNPVPPGTEDATPWTFWLTDTACDNTGRQPIVGDHLSHNTRGVCETGMQNGNNPGAPDLLYPEAPPFDPEIPIYDYATDLEPTVDPGLDKGIQVLRANDAGCANYAMEIASAPDGAEPDRYQKVHKWLSPPIPSGYDVMLDGDATLALWTKSVNEAVHAGKICIWLFIREPNPLGVPSDIPTDNDTPPLIGFPYFGYEQTQWPTEWTEIQIPLDFSVDRNLLPGSRLGLAIGVDPSGTTADGVEIMYDEPSFDSRLEVLTHSAIPNLAN